MSEHLRVIFPGLQFSPYQVASAAARHYNCIAWAANDSKNWWWPIGSPPRVVWPPAAARELTLDAFGSAFYSLSYLAATDETLERGFEKVAVFADADGKPTHAARQLSSGKWTSKLGQAEDIEHELRALEGELYGAVAMVLQRPLKR